uniref:Putative secreted protein n=1 Tax=Ixodes ricinus TaxID=34613 RepID=A0A147BC81_IXORI
MSCLVILGKGAAVAAAVVVVAGELTSVVANYATGTHGWPGTCFKSETSIDELSTHRSEWGTRFSRSEFVRCPVATKWRILQVPWLQARPLRTIGLLCRSDLDRAPPKPLLSPLRIVFHP